jgi:hypothetical protein
MLISVTELRANIYNIVDDVLRTGQPVDIERGGKKLRIMPISNEAAVTGKLNKLIARPEAITGSPEDFTHIDWSHEWNP